MTAVYERAVVALKLRTEDPGTLYEHALCFTRPRDVSLVHVIDAAASAAQTGVACCPPTGGDADFDGAALEQEYWACDAWLAHWGTRLGIPPARRGLLVGPIAPELALWVRRTGATLLVMGSASSAHARVSAPDSLATALAGVGCDVLVVGSASRHPLAA